MKKRIMFSVLILGIIISITLFFSDSFLSLTSFAIISNSPPGNVKNPAGEITVSPTELAFGLSDTQKTLTVSVTDPFVFKDVFICKKPCSLNTDWIKISEFDSGTKIAGTNYFDARAGITKSFAISRDTVNSGNNYVAVFTCKGLGNCNENKWLFGKFQVLFEEPIPQPSLPTLSCNLKSACATDETEILQLSDAANAHVALPGNTFTNKICCSSNKGPISVGIGDAFAYLSDPYNAHISLPSYAQPGMPVPQVLNPFTYAAKISITSDVKLMCMNTQQSCTNLGFDTCILSATDVENGHAAACGTVNHPYNLCCKLA